jgi:hypothetical protein
MEQINEEIADRYVLAVEALIASIVDNDQEIIALYSTAAQSGALTEEQCEDLVLKITERKIRVMGDFVESRRQCLI